MKLPPAFGFRTRRFSSQPFELPGKMGRRLLPAFGPSWGTGYIRPQCEDVWRRGAHL